jgi:hypothetical protein
MIALGTIILFCIYVIVFKAIYSNVCSKTQNLKYRVATIIILILLGFGDNIVGNIVFYYLVWEKGGERIYQSVENVSGFILETDYGNTVIPFMKYLFSNKYEFIEENVTRNNLDTKNNSQSLTYARTKGLYRFYVSNTKDENCKVYNEYYARRANNPNIPESARTPQIPGKCIASEKIESAKSKYLVKFDQDKIISKIANVSMRSTTIKDIGTDTLIAESNIIYYTGGWYKKALFGNIGAKTYPYDHIKYFRDTSFIWRVLKPVRR